MPRNGNHIAVLGAGITGLWQAISLLEDGYDVTVLEQSPSERPFESAASWLAGGMLAPDCEGEVASQTVVDLGVRSLDLWRHYYPSTKSLGSIVVALPRDKGELKRFARQTSHHRLIDQDTLTGLEPDLAGRFTHALFYPREAHVAPRDALAHLLKTVINNDGGAVRFSVAAPSLDEFDWVIDCRGLAAREDLAGLRGVRGDMLVIESTDVTINRPIRLIHPRFPLYIVPWGTGRYMIGATVIESDDDGPVTMRSALELLGAAYAIHPAFGEARILEMSAGVRPAFPDNTPSIVSSTRGYYVNGMFRHGFLTAPALGRIVAEKLRERRAAA